FLEILFRTQYSQYIQQFGHGPVIWRQLCHPNVLPFFGMYYLEGEGRLCSVSPWMEYGSIMNLIAIKPTNAERLSLILDVALGLQYLHEHNVVHGNLQGHNILVTPSRRVCIDDFRVTSISQTIMQAVIVGFSESMRRGEACNRAPELFRDEQAHFGSDVYAFACVCYEVSQAYFYLLPAMIMTGLLPFHDLRYKPVIVMIKVSEGARPSRPKSCSGSTALDGLWALMQDCWEGKAEMRPSASEIVQRLVGSLIGATTPAAPTTDWDEDFTSKFRCAMQAGPLLPSMTQIEFVPFSDGPFQFLLPTHSDSATGVAQGNISFPKERSVSLLSFTQHAENGLQIMTSRSIRTNQVVIHL
ncbi:kinase-like domain-containing protein, partial [Mycena galopus ATCC 62051]